MSSSITTTLSESIPKDNGEIKKCENDSTEDDEIQEKSDNIQEKSATEQSEGVVTVVEKTRKAAISLWTILHAQACRSKGNECPHKGCIDAKRLWHHMKSCNSGPNSACPHGYNGCQQARKLLSHIRKCRELRDRQRRQIRLRQQQVQGPQFCLLCTLLTRHDKNVTELIKRSRQNSFSSTQSTCPAVVGDVSAEAKMLMSFKKQTNSNEEQNSPPSSQECMPPPPPRPRAISIGSHIPPTSNNSYRRVAPLTRAAGKDEAYNLLNLSRKPVRLRAESLDERKGSNRTCPIDPTTEFDLRSPVKNSIKHRIRMEGDDILPSKDTGEQLMMRQRSMSCSILTPTFSKSGSCDTVMEDTIG